MSLAFVVKRLLLFFVVVWAATTFTFFLPRLAPGRDPIRERLGMMAATGGVMHEAIESMVKAYEERFGLDQPLWLQYVRYLGDMARLDFNYSLAQYPARVIDLIGMALPWTIGLLTVSTFIAFSIGSLLGGLMAWPRAPSFIKYLVPPLFTFSAVPYYLLAMILVYLLAFQLKLFPISGGSATGMMQSVSLDYILSLLHHSVLPALSIILAAIGFWALAMRGMMVTLLGEDFITMAEAKGLRGSRIFLGYGMRNAMLPQITALALSLGHVVSGALLVEIIFQYPGIGTLLFKAVAGFDYFTIYGIVFFIIVSVSLATLLLDFTYQFLDPRIRHQR